MEPSELTSKMKNLKYIDKSPTLLEVQETIKEVNQNYVPPDSIEFKNISFHVLKIKFDEEAGICELAPMKNELTFFDFNEDRSYRVPFPLRRCVISIGVRHFFPPPELRNFSVIKMVNSFFDDPYAGLGFGTNYLYPLRFPRTLDATDYVSPKEKKEIEQKQFEKEKRAKKMAETITKNVLTLLTMPESQSYSSDTSSVSGIYSSDNLSVSEMYSSDSSSWSGYEAMSELFD